jgi:alpha-1,2-mannosyltransferase
VQARQDVEPRAPIAPPARHGRRGGPFRKLAEGPVIAPLAVLSAGGALALALAEASGRQIDFDIYRMGAAHLFGSRLYAVRLPRNLMGGSAGMHFTYPPFAAFPLLPFAMLPVRLGQLVWSVLSLGALFGLTAVSVRAVKPRWPRATACTLAALALFPVLRLDPDLLTVDLGQINFVIALLVFTDLTAVLRLRNRVMPRGVLVGVAAAVKLTPLIFVPFLLLTRQFRAALTALVVGPSLRVGRPGPGLAGARG